MVLKLILNKDTIMSSNVAFLIIIFLIFGSAGTMFLSRAFKNTRKNDQPNSKANGGLNTFNSFVFLIVGGWFILAVIAGICLAFTRLR